MAKKIRVHVDGFSGSRVDEYSVSPSWEITRLPRPDGGQRNNNLIIEGDGNRVWTDIVEGTRELWTGISAGGQETDIIVPISRGAISALYSFERGFLPSTTINQSGRTVSPGILSYTSPVSPATNERWLKDIIKEDPEAAFTSMGLPPKFPDGYIALRRILDFVLSYPDEVAAADRVILGPEILARQFAPHSRAYGTEWTHAMCHSGLIKDNQWSSMARTIDIMIMNLTEGRSRLINSTESETHRINGLMPEMPGNSWDFFDFIDARMGFNLRPTCIILNGAHDSTVADIPVTAAYRQQIDKKRAFVHYQGGSYGMTRVIGTDKAVLPLEAMLKFGLGQGDLNGNFVPTALNTNGVEFKYHINPANPFMRRLHLQSLPVGSYDELIESKLVNMVRQATSFVTPGIDDQERKVQTRGLSQYPDSRFDIFGRSKLTEDKSGQKAYIALNLMTSIIAAAGIRMLSQNGEDVVLSCGGAGDVMHRTLIATILYDRRVYFVQDRSGKVNTETTSDGGAILGVANLQRQHPYNVDVSGLGYRLELVKPIQELIGPMKEYIQKFNYRCDFVANPS